MYHRFAHVSNGGRRIALRPDEDTEMHPVRGGGPRPKPGKSRLSMLSRQLAVGGWLAVSLGSASATDLLLGPSTTTTTPGSEFSVDLLAVDVTDLYAYQFSLGFNPNVVSVVSVTEGPTLGSVGTTFFIPGAADNSGGSLGLTADTLIGPIGGFSGTGSLATVTFLALAGGSSALALGDVLLLDSQFNSIDSTVESATVTVTSPVPEPPPTELWGVGAGLLAALRKFRRRLPD